MQKLQHFSAFTTFQLAKIDISAEAFRVCIFLLEKSFYKHGVCSASMQEIAESCFYAKTKRNLEISIPSYLFELEKLKIIEIKKEKGVTNTYKLLNLEYAKIFTKSKSISEKVEKKEVKKVYKKPEKTAKVQTVTQVHEEKQVQVQAHKVQTRPQFCDEIAVEWINWRRERGLEKGFPIEEYATHIYHAYPHLPVQNYNFFMREVFAFIKQSEFWGKKACSTPECLVKKHEGSIKILKIYEDMCSSKNLQVMMYKQNNEDIKDKPDFKDFCRETGFN